MNQQKKTTMELNDAQLESVSGGMEPDTIQVIGIMEATPREIEDEIAWKRTIGPWTGLWFKPCTNCGEIAVYKDTVEENENKIKVIRCAKCGHMEYV